MKKYPQSCMTVHEHQLFQALKKMHDCLNNHILGNVSDATHDEKFYLLCHEACNESRKAIESIFQYYDVDTKPAW